LANLQEIRRRPDERDADIVDAVPEAELEVLAVLLGQDREAERGAREVHALVILDRPARGDATRDVLTADVLHIQGDATIVDQDTVTGLDIPSEAAVRDARPLGRAHHGLRRQHEGIAAPKDDPAIARKGAEANLGTLKVLQDR